MDAFSISAVGMAAATQRFDASAARTASGDSDPVAETVDQVQSATAFEAAAATFKAADKMIGALLDLKV
jgi:flagellar basal body rod protein FlgC